MAKIKYPLKDHWEGFKTHKYHCHPDTIAYIETILGEEISKDSFIIAHKRMCHAKHKGQHAKELWRFLSENKWIIESK